MIDEQLIATLHDGGVAIVRTDTLYGVVGRADSKATVERIYHIKGRKPTKSPIVLIGDTSQLLDQHDTSLLATIAQQELWPGPNSIILPSPHGPTWLTRDNASIAYRLPADGPLRELLMQTGPLVAPSANPEGLPPATTIAEARAYFGDAIDYYHDSGPCLNSQPSSLLAIEDGAIIRLR